MKVLKRLWNIFALLAGLGAFYVSYHAFKEDDTLKAVFTLIWGAILTIDYGIRLLAKKQRENE